MTETVTSPLLLPHLLTIYPTEYRSFETTAEATSRRVFPPTHPTTANACHQEKHPNWRLRILRQCTKYFCDSIICIQKEWGFAQLSINVRNAAPWGLGCGFRRLESRVWGGWDLAWGQGGLGMMFLGMGKVDGRMGLPVAVGNRYVYFYLRIPVIETASSDREKWPTSKCPE